MDHLISEMLTYFDPNNEAVMSFLLYVLPALLVYWEGNPVQAALQYYADDLPPPQGFKFDVKLFHWRHRLLSVDQDLSSSTIQALEECDNELFPIVHTLNVTKANWSTWQGRRTKNEIHDLSKSLVSILCTSTITSERFFSTLRRLKTLLRATMHDQWERVCSCPNAHHYKRQIDVIICNNWYFCTNASQAPPSCRYLSWVNANHNTTVTLEECNTPFPISPSKCGRCLTTKSPCDVQA